VALEGTTVSMKLEMPVEDIVKAIREEAAKKLEKKAE
jgi:hypothetical protein